MALDKTKPQEGPESRIDHAPNHNDPSAKAQQYMKYVGERPPLTKAGAKNIIFHLGNNFAETRDDMRNWGGLYGSKEEAVAKLKLLESASTAFTESNPNPPTDAELNEMKNVRCFSQLEGIDPNMSAVLYVLKLREGTYCIARAARELREKIESSDVDDTLMDIAQKYLNTDVDQTMKQESKESTNYRNDVKLAFLEDCYPAIARDPKIRIAIDLQKNMYDLATSIATLELKTQAEPIKYTDCTVQMALSHLRTNAQVYELSEHDIEILEQKAKDKNHSNGIKVLRDASELLKETVMNGYPE